MAGSSVHAEDEVGYIELEEEEEEQVIDNYEGGEYYDVSVQSSGVSGDALSASYPIRSNAVIDLENVVEEEEGSKRRKMEPCSSTENLCSQEYERNWNEIDGLFCPICMDAWTTEGDHHLCCLPCGHLYGMSCIRKWLQQRQGSGKCPQCNRTCKRKDVRKLFAPRIVAIDEEAQKRIRSLETKCASLEKKDVEWRTREAEWEKANAEWQAKLQEFSEKIACLEYEKDELCKLSSQKIMDSQRLPVSGQNGGSRTYAPRSCCSFELEKAICLDGARLLDIDASSQILLIAHRPPPAVRCHKLTKMSLIPPHEVEDILLPADTNSVKDIHFSPSDGRLALFASLGKKLSVISLESNNLVLTYNLETPVWSCSWDLNNSNYVYAGLQNGSLLEFDLRQTARPLKSVKGLTNNPIHTVQSFLQDSTVAPTKKTVLSASAIGLCQWTFAGAMEGPQLIPDIENQGVCISLAYSPGSADIVASYRPKIILSDEMLSSQPPSSLYQPIRRGIEGSHVSIQRKGNHFQTLGHTCASVSDMLLPKSAIIDTQNQSRLFASEDSVAGELVLQDLPSFTVVQRCKLPEYPMRDVKYSRFGSQCIIGCLSGECLQLLSAKLP